MAKQLGLAQNASESCLACARAETVGELLALRILQSLATGTAFAVSRAMLSDLFSGDRLARSLSLTMMIMTVAPLIAPGIGGEILSYLGWRWIFLALSAIGAVTTILCWLLLNETLSAADRLPFRPMAIITRYGTILSNRHGLGLACIAGLLSAAYFANLASVSFIIIDYHNGSSRLFAAFFASAGVMAIFANFVNAKLVVSIGYRRMLFTGLVLAMINAAALLYVTLTDAGGVWGVIACVVWLMGLFQTISSNAMAGFLSLFRDRAGAASAVFGSIRFSFGIAGSAAVGALYTGHPSALGVVAFVSISSAAIVAILCLKTEGS